MNSTRSLASKLEFSAFLPREKIPFVEKDLKETELAISVVRSKKITCRRFERKERVEYGRVLGPEVET